MSEQDPQWERQKAAVDSSLDQHWIEGRLAMHQERTSRPLTWTTDKPEKSGWYWYRENNNAQVAFIEFGPSGHGIAEFCEDCRESLFLLNGEWAGPIEPPQ